MVVETAYSGESVVFDETARRRSCHSGRTGTEILLDEIRADSPSAARARKLEFGIPVVLPANMMRLVEQARAVFDETDDVPPEIERELVREFTPIFLREVAPYLTDPS